MRKRIVSLFCIVAVMCAFSIPTFAAVTSAISISAGGDGYSDTGLTGTSYTIPYGPYESCIRYSRCHMKLISFKFANLDTNVKPVSNVRFNFRPVTKDSHYNAGDVIYCYDAGGTSSGAMSSGYGYSGQKVAIKSNITNWSSSACTLACQWYLYNP